MSDITERINELSKAIETYQTLGERIEKWFKEDPSRLGGDEWLRHVIDTYNMNLDVQNDGIRVHGCAYTMQTMSNEWFDFVVPWEEIA